MLKAYTARCRVWFYGTEGNVDITLGTLNDFNVSGKNNAIRMDPLSSCLITV